MTQSKNGYLVSAEGFALLQAARALTKRFGIYQGRIVTAKGDEDKAQELLTEVVRLAWELEK